MWWCPCRVNLKFSLLVSLISMKRLFFLCFCERHILSDMKFFFFRKAHTAVQTRLSGTSRKTESSLILAHEQDTRKTDTKVGACEIKFFTCVLSVCGDSFQRVKSYRGEGSKNSRFQFWLSQEVCDDHQSARHKGLHEVFSWSESIQWIQVSLWCSATQHIPHAVVSRQNKFPPPPLKKKKEAAAHFVWRSWKDVFLFQVRTSEQVYVAETIWLSESVAVIGVRDADHSRTWISIGLHWRQQNVRFLCVNYDRL